MPNLHLLDPNNITDHGEYNKFAESVEDGDYIYDVARGSLTIATVTELGITTASQVSHITIKDVDGAKLADLTQKEKFDSDAIDNIYQNLEKIQLGKAPFDKK